MPICLPSRAWWLNPAWRRGLEPEILLELALGQLAAPHRFGDQLIGQNQPRVGDVFHHQRDVGFFAGAAVIAMKPYGVAFDALQGAAKPLAALMGDRHLDLHEMTNIALEIGTPHQRTVDSGRGNLQPVGLFDRIGDIEHRRERL